jgi:hypothetical protein
MANQQIVVSVDTPSEGVLYRQHGTITQPVLHHLSVPDPILCLINGRLRFTATGII